MPSRDKYPKKYFEGNPFEGVSLRDMYTRLQWGNEPQEILEVDAPEPLVALGEIARLELEDRVIEFDEKEAHLAIGAETNRIYIFPIGADRVPDVDEMDPIGEIYQTDYYSDKGGSKGYYFHEHEDPFPVVHAGEAGFFIIEPEDTDEGRSYAVSDEGIIG